MFIQIQFPDGMLHKLAVETTFSKILGEIVTDFYDN